MNNKLNNIYDFDTYMSTEMLEEGNKIKTAALCLLFAVNTLGTISNAEAQNYGGIPLGKHSTPTMAQRQSEKVVIDKIDKALDELKKSNKNEDSQLDKLIQNDFQKRMELKKYQDSVENEKINDLKVYDDAFKLSVYDDAGHCVFEYDYSSGDTLINDIEKIVYKVIKINKKYNNKTFDFYLAKRLSKEKTKTPFCLKTKANDYDELDGYMILNPIIVHNALKSFISLERNHIVEINKDFPNIGYDENHKVFELNPTTFEWEERETFTISRDDL